MITNPRLDPFAPKVIDQAVYGTIVVMSVLIIYDGWSHLRLLDLVGIIVGPLVAMFVSHVFSTFMAEQVALGRSLSAHERLQAIRRQASFLLLAIPPILIASVLYGAGVSLTGCIRVVLIVGALSLGLWGGVAGYRAHFRRWRLVMAVAAGLTIGGLVLLLQVALQPGKAVTGGVAVSIQAVLNHV